MAANRCRALIIDGRSSRPASSSPVEDGIKIAVRPTITGDGFVSLTLDAQNDTATLVLFTNKADPNDPNASTIRLPTLDTTKPTTTIMVADGRTAVIGGLLKNKTFEDERKVPVIGNIPVLGWLFKKREDRIEQRNLTIFITPRIVPLADKSEYDVRRQELHERLSGTKEQPADKQQPLGATESTGP